MFKKLASIVLAAMMIGSTAIVAASAAESTDAVAAEDSSAVGADDSSAVGAEGSESTGADSKVYFDVSSMGWNNYKSIMIYLYEHNGDVLIQWQSKKGRMTDEGNGKYSFDLAAKGYPLDAGKEYACIFLADTGVQTCDLMIGPECYGDTAVGTGEKIENTEDSNKKSDGVKWTNNSAKYDIPLGITSIGNIVGKSLWKGDTKYSLFVAFLKDTGKKGIDNAVKFNGKTVQQTIDDTAKTLGLGTEDIKKAIKESGRTLDWKEASSSAEKGSKVSDGGSGDTNTNTNTNSNTTGGTTGGSNGGSSGGSTGSVTSGEETTVYFVIGGIMLAAAGVFFLARKRREY